MAFPPQRGWGVKPRLGDKDGLTALFQRLNRRTPRRLALSNIFAWQDFQKGVPAAGVGEGSGSEARVSGLLAATCFQTKPPPDAHGTEVGVLAPLGGHPRPPLGSRLSHTWSFSVLQVLGFEIDALNSVQFSNHTGKALASVVAAEQGVGTRRGLEKSGGPTPHLMSWSRRVGGSGCGHC